MTVTIWHNPRCSKSRETLALLTARGIEPEIVHYLETPPGKAQILAAAKALGVGVRDMMRTKEAAYKDQGLDDAALSDAQLAEAMSRTPALIERPIVFAGHRAAIGRPPEYVLTVLP
ncbi:MAG: arsenate reductase (glutaredoxin) [Parvularculaceae bacterium]